MFVFFASGGDSPYLYLGNTDTDAVVSFDMYVKGYKYAIYAVMAEGKTGFIVIIRFLEFMQKLVNVLAGFWFVTYL